MPESYPSSATEVLRSVSVVIPSLGRSELSRAVQSALAQQRVRVEVLVILNGDYESYENSDPRVRVVEIPERGQGPARDAGVSLASFDYVALLDDDDYWRPEKLDEQLLAVEEMGPSVGSSNWIATCGVFIGADGKWAERAQDLGHLEENCYSLPDYVFVRRGKSWRPPLVQSSTLLFARELALQVPFQSVPEIHTDWGWIIEVQRRGRVRLISAPRALSFYDVGGASSVSKKSKGADSVAWADRMLSEASDRARGEFLLNISARFFVRSGDLKGWMSAMRKALKSGSPSARSVVFAIALLARKRGRL